MLEENRVKEEIRKIILTHNKKMRENQRRLEELVDSYYRMFKGEKPGENIPSFGKIIENKGGD